MTLETRLVNLAATGRRLVEQGLARGEDNSVSLRWQELCYISPAAARLDRLSAADFVPLAFDHAASWQLQRASAAHALHLACYRARPDIATVFQLQPLHCTALGCAGLSIPVITPEFYRALGGSVSLVPYALPGSQALADQVAEGIARHNAVLLQNRSVLVVAPSTDEAFARAVAVEEAAHIVLLAHAATGSCSSLTTEQIEELEHLAGRRQRTDQAP